MGRLRFWIRNHVTATPPIGRVRPTDVRAELDRIETTTTPEQAARLRELRDRYPTAAWRSCVRPYEVAENVLVLDLLDALLAPRSHVWQGRALDVGAKNWTYLAALRSAVALPWDGVELDAHRRYRSGQTRASVAGWRVGAHPGCRYLAGPAQAVSGSYQLVTCLLPFVTPVPHARWGLPARWFDPAGHLAHVWSLVQPSGTLVIVNQSEREAEVQAALLHDAGIHADATGPLPQLINPFPRTYHAFVAQRPPDVHSGGRVARTDTSIQRA